MTRRPITDSPWFWLLAIVACALFGTMLIRAKYARRQEGVERKYHAREEIARRQITGEAAPVGDELVEVPLPGESDLIVPLWRLQVVLMVALAVAMALFWRAHAGGG